MDKSAIQAGEEYGVRESRSRDAPLQHVRVLEHVRGRKWKVEWIEPNPGLVDYLESKHIVIRWKERKAFLRDEERERQLRADNDRLEYEETPRSPKPSTPFSTPSATRSSASTVAS